MRPVHRTLVLAVSIASLGIGAALAQTAPTGNPLQRGNSHDPFSYGPLNGKPPQGDTQSMPLGQLIKRPGEQRAGAVTPVPEPSQWAMMLAGLALVGFIVKRRNGAR